jgi:hypothetical protein
LIAFVQTSGQTKVGNLYKPVWPRGENEDVLFRELVLVRGMEVMGHTNPRFEVTMHKPLIMHISQAF